eukprot:g3626.t1
MTLRRKRTGSKGSDSTGMKDQKGVSSPDALLYAEKQWHNTETKMEKQRDVYEQKLVTVEKTYQYRYNTLKRIYDQRLQSMSKEMIKIAANIRSDDLMKALGDDDLTTQFQLERIVEIMQGSVARERETAFQNTAEQLAARESQVAQLSMQMQQMKQSYDRTITELQRENTLLRDEVEKEADTNDDLTSALEEATEKYDRFAEKSRIMLEANEKEKDAMTKSMLALKDSLRESTLISSKDETLSRHVDQLEERIRGHEKMLHAKDKQLEEKDEQVRDIKKRNNEVENESANLRAELKEISSAKNVLQNTVADLRRQVSGLSESNSLIKKQHQNVCRDVEKLEGLLEQSENERLQVRQQYFAISNKVEELMATESRESAQVIAKLEGQLKQAEDKVEIGKRRLNEKLKACRGAIRERDVQIAALEDDVESAATKYKDAMAKAEKLQAELNVAHTSNDATARDLQKRLDKCQSDLASCQKTMLDERKRWREQRSAREKRWSEDDKKNRTRIQDLENEIKGLHDHERKRLDEWEKKQQAAQITLTEKLRTEIQKEWEGKMKIVQEEREKMEKEKAESKNDGDRVKGLVVQQITEMNKGVIPLPQHQQILDAKCAALKAEHNNRENELRSKMDEEMRLRIKEVEERRAHEYSMAMVQVRQGIKKLEREIAEEKRMRTELDTLLKEERAALVSLRYRAEESEKNKAVLIGHLEEASGVIGRLKGMLMEERRTKEGITSQLKSQVQVGERRDHHTAEVETQLKNMEELQEKTRQALEEQRTTNDELSAMIAELKIQLKEKEANIQILQGEKEKMLGSLEGATQQIVSDREKLVEQQQKDMEALKNSYKKEIASLQSEISSREKTIGEQDILLNQKNSQLQERKSELLSSHSSHEKDTQEIITLNSTIAALQEELKMETESRNKLGSDRDQMETKLRDELNTCKKQLALAQNTIEMERANFAERRSSTKALLANALRDISRRFARPLKERQIALQVGFKENLREMYGEFRRCVEKIEAKHSRILRSVKARMNTETQANVTRLKKQYEHELEALRKTLLQEHKKEKERDDQIHAQRLAHLKATLDGSSQGVEKGQEQLAEVMSQLEDCKQKLADERAKCKEVEGKLLAQVERVTGEQKQNIEMKNRINELKKEIEHRQSEIDQSQTKVNELEREKETQIRNLGTLFMALHASVPEISFELQQAIIDNFPRTKHVHQQNFSIAITRLSNVMKDYEKRVEEVVRKESEKLVDIEKDRYSKLETDMANAKKDHQAELEAEWKRLEESEQRCNQWQSQLSERSEELAQSRLEIQKIRNDADRTEAEWRMKLELFQASSTSELTKAKEELSDERASFERDFVAQKETLQEELEEKLQTAKREVTRIKRESLELQRKAEDRANREHHKLNELRRDMITQAKEADLRIREEIELRKKSEALVKKKNEEIEEILAAKTEADQQRQKDSLMYSTHISPSQIRDRALIEYSLRQKSSSPAKNVSLRTPAPTTTTTTTSSSLASRQTPKLASTDEISRLEELFDRSYGGGSAIEAGGGVKYKIHRSGSIDINIPNAKQRFNVSDLR